MQNRARMEQASVVRIHESKRRFESLPAAFYSGFQNMKCPDQRFRNKVLERHDAVSGWLIRAGKNFQPVKSKVLQKGYLYPVQRNGRERFAFD